MQAKEAVKFAEWEKLERPYPWKERQFLETMESSSQKTLVWEEEGTVIGFGVLQLVQDESYLLNIMIKRENRGQGKGATLLKKLMEWSKSCGAAQFVLDVDPMNKPAVQLYESAGFKVVGRRPHGYPGGEESLLMKTFLCAAALIVAAFFMPLNASADQTNKKSEAYNFYLKAIVQETQGNLAAAEEQLNQALLLAPESAYLHHAAAELTFRQNKFEESRDHIEKAISLDPTNVKLYILAGQVHWAMGDQAKAEARLKKAVELGPDEAEALVNLAMAVTPKNPKEAIRLYNDYLERHPMEQEIHERLAQLYQANGDLDKAKAEWGKVLDLDSESIRAHLASAQLAEVQHDTATAVGHYEAVLEQDPSNLPLLLRVGELRYRNDEMAQAYAAFSKAQSIAPNSASANFWLALIAENKGDWAEAIRLLKSVAEKAPEPGVLLRLSFYYSQIGQRKEAIKLLKKLSDDEPENTDFLRYLAVAYEQDQQYSNALIVVGKLIAIDPTNADHYFHKATLHDRMKQFALSEEALKKAIEIDPQFHMALNYLGYSYAERNIKLDEAERLVNDAISMDPENEAYLDSMGWVYYRQGKYKKAEDFLTQAANAAHDAVIWEHLGDAQAAQGKLLPALASWEMAQRLDPQGNTTSKKIEKASARLTSDEKRTVNFQRAKEDFSSVASIEGLTKISFCKGRACADVNARFSYAQPGNLSVDVPGPMGSPVLMVQKSTGSAVQFGSIRPDILEIESYVKKSFDRIYQVWRGSVFQPKSEAQISFEEKSGRLKEIVWGAPGATDRLNFSGKSKESFVPPLWTWKDDQNAVSIKVEFLKPVLRSAYAESN